MSVASAMTTGHRDHLLLAFYVQWPKILPLVSQDQIVPIEPDFLYGWTDNYNFNDAYAQEEW